jgi:hypothetical protein
MSPGASPLLLLLLLLRKSTSSVGKSAPRCTCESAGGKNVPYGGLVPEAELLEFVASLPEGTGSTAELSMLEMPPGGTLDGKLLLWGLPMSAAVSVAPPELLFSPDGGCMYVCMHVYVHVYR